MGTDHARHWSGPKLLETCGDLGPTSSYGGDPIQTCAVHTVASSADMGQASRCLWAFGDADPQCRGDCYQRCVMQEPWI